MRVRMLTSLAGPDLSLNVGDEHDFEDAEAVRHVEAGHAVPVAPPVERAVKAAPEKRKK